MLPPVSIRFFALRRTLPIFCLEAASAGTAAKADNSATVNADKSIFLGLI